VRTPESPEPHTWPTLSWLVEEEAAPRCFANATSMTSAPARDLARRRVLALIAVVMALALPACRDDELQSAHASPGAPYIIGVIAGRAPGEIFVVHTSSCDSEATVTLFFKARVVDATGVDTDTTALVVGRRVAVWSTGTVDESCPPITGAKLIVLQN
jgi:hypothetical protein